MNSVPTNLTEAQVCFPASIFLQLTEPAKNICAVLALHGGKWDRSIPDLGHQINRGRRCVEGCLPNLERLGLVEIERRDGKPSIIKLQPTQNIAHLPAQNTAYADVYCTFSSRSSISKNGKSSSTSKPKTSSASTSAKRRAPQKREAYQPSPNALKAVAYWRKSVHELKKEDSYYAKAFDDLHDLDKLPWLKIKEICIGVVVCGWIENGYIFSPNKLRTNIRSGEMKTWEEILRQYRLHPKFKPLSEVPKCPTCGEVLKWQEGQRDGGRRLFKAWFCIKHPVESAKLGEEYTPMVLIKKDGKDVRR